MDNDIVGDTRFSSGAYDADHANEYKTIGQLASHYQVSLRTLRFYEDKGLLSPLRHGTMRLYDGRQRNRLEMILKGKRLGFTLAEIREMLGSRLREEPVAIEASLAPAQVETQLGMLERQRLALDEAIRELRETQLRFETPGASTQSAA